MLLFKRTIYEALGAIFVFIFVFVFVFVFFQSKEHVNIYAKIRLKEFKVKRLILPPPP